jgi:two-component system response regulator HydG
MGTLNKNGQIYLMNNAERILIVDDDEFIRLSLMMLLEQYYKNVEVLADPKRIETLLQHNKVDVVLLDMNYRQGDTSGNEGIYWLTKIKEISPGTSVVLMTAYGDIKNAVEAIKQGALDFVVKPWHNEKLLATLSSAVIVAREKLKVDKLKSKQQLRTDSALSVKIIGQSDAMLAVYNIVDKVAETDANVLILGSNGTGKELIAKSLHSKSGRKNADFISVDLGAIPESLFESELFGYKKGAFTDAKTDRMGLFEAADGGTIFLDEVGNLSANAQAKLLAVLQNRQITRLGSTQPIDIDIRVISATNADLTEMIEEGKFREDLLYRINTVELKIPDLINRKEDIEMIAKHFLSIYSRKYGKQEITLAKETIRGLERYPWPGNVRELQHAVERAVIMAEDAVLLRADFSFLTGNNLSKVADDNYNLENLERWAIQNAIDKYKGNISHAAKELGLSRGAMYRRMEKYGL